MNDIFKQDDIDIRKITKYNSDFFKYLKNLDSPKKNLKKEIIVENYLNFLEKQSEKNIIEIKKLYSLKHSDISFENFIFKNILGFHSDVLDEFLILEEKAHKYKTLLEKKDKEFEQRITEINIGKESRKKQKKEKDKFIYNKTLYFKKKFDNLKAKGKTAISEKNIIEKAINHARRRGIIYKKDDYSDEIYELENLEFDTRFYVCFGDLSIESARNMVKLRKSDSSAYLACFLQIINERNVIGEILNKTKENFYLHDRYKLLYETLDLFKNQKYLSFVYLLLPQIEGFFQIYLNLQGDKSRSEGMKQIVQKINKKEIDNSLGNFLESNRSEYDVFRYEFLEFSYFEYDLPELRNKIAHGKTIAVNEELAYTILMSVYWIINKIEKEDLEYKQLLILLKNMKKKDPIDEILKYFTASYPRGIGKKREKVLMKWHEEKYNELISWYSMEKEALELKNIFESPKLYNRIWDGNTDTKIFTGEKINGCDVIKFNSSPLEYKSFVNMLKNLSLPYFTSGDWYQRYMFFCNSVEEDEKIFQRNYKKQFFDKNNERDL